MSSSKRHTHSSIDHGIWHFSPNHRYRNQLVCQDARCTLNIQFRQERDLYWSKGNYGEATHQDFLFDGENKLEWFLWMMQEMWESNNKKEEQWQYSELFATSRIRPPCVASLRFLCDQNHSLNNYGDGSILRTNGLYLEGAKHRRDDRWWNVYLIGTSNVRKTTGSCVPNDERQRHTVRQYAENQLKLRSYTYHTAA